MRKLWYDAHLLTAFVLDNLLSSEYFGLLPTARFSAGHNFEIVHIGTDGLLWNQPSEVKELQEK